MIPSVRDSGLVTAVAQFLYDEAALWQKLMSAG
jgi:hypothetical protein